MNESPTPPTTCPVCGRQTPSDRFCGACGADLSGRAEPSSGRTHAFAANPSEHVLQPSVTLTLFPHLSQERSASFRLALVLVAGLLLVVGYLRLTGPVVAVAAAAVPLLYGVYLYEVEVYEDQPIYAVGITAGVGLVLGAAWAVLAGRFITQTSLLNATPQGAPTGRILVVAIVFPLVVQLLMFVGPLVLRFTSSYDEVLDGFAFGAASALGFLFAANLINLLPDLQSGPTSSAGDVASAFRSLTHGMLVPLIDAGTTGLVAAALWLGRSRTRRLPRFAWTTSLVAAVAIAVVVRVGLGVADVFVISAASSILIYVGVAFALLLWIRFALHNMLLAEAADLEDKDEALCVNCGHVVSRMAFCPRCGVATRATSKLGFGGENRRVR